LPAGIQFTDTAAAALWLLCLEPAESIEGRPVTAAFE
jgi:hypothetical protein